MLDVSRLRVLVAIARTGSVTAAAKELHYSQPSVSHHLAVLRQNGLVTSWRAGRRVLYQRTPLGTDVVVAGGGAARS